MTSIRINLQTKKISWQTYVIECTIINVIMSQNHKNSTIISTKTQTQLCTNSISGKNLQFRDGPV